jgi:prepilin-type N-terminal cleavage/methylation domain-containing protein
MTGNRAHSGAEPPSGRSRRLPLIMRPPACTQRLRVHARVQGEDYDAIPPAEVGGLQVAGFTLIEVIVVVAIIAIISGIMVPMMYRVWESSDQDLTLNRLKDLQVAMIGDSRLFQNGVRTHFGYVGDIGQLPPQGALADLKDDPGASVVNWKGPYLPSGYDAANYARDAWGRDIEYLVTATDANGRRYEATLRSNGPDGIPGSADDIVSTITMADVLPLGGIQGNVTINFPSVQTNRYIGIVATYRNGFGSPVTETCCDSAHVVSGSTGTVISQYFDCSLAKKLPMGAVILTPKLYNSATCGTSVLETTLSAAAIISSSSLFINLQIQ